MSHLEITIIGRQVKFRGIEIGRTSLMNLQFKAGGRAVWAHIKVEGRMVWAGVGDKRYEPAHILVMQIHRPKITAGPPKALWQLTGEVSYPFDHEVYPKASENTIVETMKRLQEAQK